MALVDELTSGPADKKQTVVSTLEQLSTGTPMEEFIIVLLGMAERKGVLDAAFSGEESSVEDQMDNAAGIENQDFVDKEDMAILVEKFVALPPEQQKTLLDAVKQEDPELANQILAAIRLIKGREG